MLENCNQNKDKNQQQFKNSQEKKREVEEDTSEDANKQGVETVTTIVETKTVKDGQCNPTTIVATTKSRTFGPPPSPTTLVQLVRRWPTKQQLQNLNSQCLRKLLLQYNNHNEVYTSIKESNKFKSSQKCHCWCLTSMTKHL